jgi:hypothetical protein
MEENFTARLTVTEQNSITAAAASYQVSDLRMLSTGKGVNGDDVHPPDVDGGCTVAEMTHDGSAQSTLNKVRTTIPQIP